MAAKPEQVKSARHFLRNRKLGMSARKFANAAIEQGRSFSELLRFIMRTIQGQQNQSAQRREVIQAAAEGEKE